jgi:hypothetical protein
VPYSRNRHSSVSVEVASESFGAGWLEAGVITAVNYEGLHGDVVSSREALPQCVISKIARLGAKKS